MFDSPKKVGLRGNLKSVFSGKSRVVIPVPVPKGCDALVYSLRISTNEKTISSDGKFSENLSLYSSKIKLFGFNVYEGNISSGVVDRLLFNTRPPRDEDAFCNMYVFNNSSQAKNFKMEVPHQEIINMIWNNRRWVLSLVVDNCILMAEKLST